MSSAPTLEPISLSNVQLPFRLSEQLSEDERRFGGNSSSHDAIAADLQAHSARRDAIFGTKSKQGHDQVAHAKEVAAHHNMNSANNIPRVGGDGQVKASATSTTAALESDVEAKRQDLERQQQELDDLSAKLARADEVERSLRAKLGEAV